MSVPSQARQILLGIDVAWLTKVAAIDESRSEIPAAAFRYSRPLRASEHDRVASLTAIACRQNRALALPPCVHHAIDCTRIKARSIGEQNCSGLGFSP